MKAEQIRKLPVGPVLDLLRAGVYMEIGNFRIQSDMWRSSPRIYVQTWEGEAWSNGDSLFEATIDGVANMLINFAERMEAKDEQS